ncbi:hypothetical protein GIB67_026885, partial [Kingdonia uniflora]
MGEKFDTIADSHSDTEGVKSKVERKESLLDEVAKEETELKLVLEGLGLSRKKRVDSRSNKVRKNWSTRSMAGVDEGKGNSAQPNPVKPSKITLKYLKKRMLKALPASGTTGSCEVAKDKRRRVKTLGESGEKVAEGRSTVVDNLKEVEERARLAVLLEEEDTSKIVAHLVKGIWLGVEEEKSELKKVNVELKKELARSRTDALMEVRQLKASHSVAIGQLQVETKANLDEMVEERDRLGHHLMLKGYSEKEVDAIKADTYYEEEDEEEVEVMGIVDGLDGVSSQMVLDNQGDDIKLLKCGTEKVELDSSRSPEDDVLMCNREFMEQFDRMKEANESREDQYVKVHFRLVELTQAVSDLTLQVEEKDFEIKRRLKELAEVTEYTEKLQSRVDALGMKVEKDDELRVAQENLSVLEAAVEHLQIALPAKDMEFREMQRRCSNLNERVARLKAELAQAIARAKKVKAREHSGGSRTEGHVQKGNANLREYQHKLDTALIREKILEGEIKAKESLVKGKEELCKDIPAKEELNTKIGRLRARVVDLEAMNLVESVKYIVKLEENVIYHAKVDAEITEQKNEYP